jgi:hypothetical protein
MNIATVFGPTLLRRRTEVAESMGTGCRVVQELLKVTDQFWNDVIATAQIPLVEQPADGVLAPAPARPDSSAPKAAPKMGPSRQNSIQCVRDPVHIAVGSHPHPTVSTATFSF